ncbi:MAG: ATP-binding protein [Ktedonobacterales bacterium]|nr:ATP-binding protein [Ktedonobacterales bacterium]
MVTRPHFPPHRLGSTQQQFVGAWALVGDDTLCLGTPDRDSTLPRVADQFCAVLAITPLNYMLRSAEEQETIISSYLSFLNALPFPVQILVRVLKLDLEPYLARLGEHATRLAAEHEAASRHEDAVLLELTQDNIAFVRSLATRRRLLERHFYVVIPTTPATEMSGVSRLEILWRHLARLRPRSTEDRLLQGLQWQAVARQQLDLRVREVARQLGRVGLGAQRLRGTELVNLYYSCLTPQKATQHPLAAATIAGAQLPPSARAPRAWRRHRTRRTPLPPLTDPTSELPTTDDPPARDATLAPGSAAETEPPALLTIADLLAPAAAEIGAQHITLDGEYARVFAVVGYPRYVYPGWLAQLIALDIPLEWSIHLRPRDSATMIQRLSRQMVEFRASEILETRQGRMPDPERMLAYADVERLRDHLQHGDEKIFEVAIYGIVRAPSEQALNERFAQVQAALSAMLLVAHPATFEQDIAFGSCLPEARDRWNRSRLLDSSTIATAFPFASANLSMPDGILYGVDGSGGLVILDPFSSQLENANQVVFAKSGAGKSYACKIQAVRSLMTGTAICVIDPENEWGRLCAAVGGQLIHLRPGSPQHVNPFDLFQDTSGTASSEEDRGDLLAEKILSLITLMDLLLADHVQGRATTLSQREKSFLERVLFETYHRHGIYTDPQTHAHPAPLLSDVYAVLTSGACGPDDFHLGDRLQRYVTGSMAHLFNAPTNVALANKFVVFNIREMEAELRPIGLFMIADFVWTRMRREHARQPRQLFIDEAWSLMQFPEGGRFLSDMARRARKYYLGLVTITQDVEDFLTNEHGRTVLVNASIKILMKQDASTIASVAGAFHLSQGERSFILGCNKGEGLLFARNAHVALHVDSSEWEHHLVTSDPSELAKRHRAHPLPEEAEPDPPSEALVSVASPTSDIPIRRSGKGSRRASPATDTSAGRNGQHPARSQGAG